MRCINNLCPYNNTTLNDCCKHDSECLKCDKRILMDENIKKILKHIRKIQLK